MDYKVLRETTDWGAEKIPNHTYYIRPDGKCVGYVNAITGIEEFFRKPFSFDKRRRTFKEVK